MLHSLRRSNPTSPLPSAAAALYHLTPPSDSVTTPIHPPLYRASPLPSSQFKPRVGLWGSHPICSPMVRACFSTETTTKETQAPTEIVAELYQKMLESVEKVRTCPPNANLLSLIDNCANHEDIKLLFQMLQRLRTFRLSNLRIHADFNVDLCMRITKACARADALDYGIKALWKHNVYGLTPNIGSAHNLLLHVKEKNDAKQMVKIMNVIKKNSLPLQPGTADIVFSICYNTNDWSLITKYSRRFLKAGVKLHRAAFDIWMEFAARRGDVKSIWEIEKQRLKIEKERPKIGKKRSKTVNKHTLASVFSCAKGHLIKHHPESAAAIINHLYQGLPDHKKPSVADGLQKLVSEWTPKLAKKQKKEVREAFVESLRSDISAMVSSLINMGIHTDVELEQIKC